MKTGIDEPQVYLGKLAPLYIELFRAGHSIVGNAELAEFVLKKAAYEAWQRREEWEDRMSFAEGLGQTVRMVALSELQSIKGVGSFDKDWQLPQVDEQQLNAEQRHILTKLNRESPELLRALILYYACGLRVGQIGTVLGLRTGQVREMLYMFRTRLERSRLRSGSKHMMEDNLERLLQLMLATDGPDVPDFGPLFRAFERDAALAPKPKLLKSRIAGLVLGGIGAVICGVAFWLVAVLMDGGAAPIPPDPPAQIEAEVAKSQHETNGNHA